MSQACDENCHVKNIFQSQFVNKRCPWFGEQDMIDWEIIHGLPTNSKGLEWIYMHYNFKGDNLTLMGPNIISSIKFNDPNTPNSNTTKLTSSTLIEWVLKLCK